MNIVLPIVFFALIVGLFVPESRQKQFRWILILWIIVVIANYWRKN